MKRAVSLLLLPVLLRVQAGEEADPAAILRRAVEAQGKLGAGQVQNVRLVFKGSILEQGRHAIRREYWYRASDRSFRVRTRSEVKTSRSTDRGVVGDAEFWERASDGSRLRLSPGNREDRKVTDGIRREREEFETALRLVFLSRLLGPETRVTFGSAGPVRLERDLPFNAKDIFGEDRSPAYFVLDVERPEESRLRLYVRSGDFTVRKAVLFQREDPAVADWIYYFGPFYRDTRLDLQLPRFLSAHVEEPVDEPSRDRGGRAWGALQEITLNTALDDAVFRGEGE